VLAVIEAKRLLILILILSVSLRREGGTSRAADGYSHGTERLIEGMRNAFFLAEVTPFLIWFIESVHFLWPPTLTRICGSTAGAGQRQGRGQKQPLVSTRLGINLHMIKTSDLTLGWLYF
jgi:hypothetical protein